MANDPQVPWTDEQWARVNQVIQEEAKRARVAATFLPLYGPLDADADFVRRQDIYYPTPTAERNAADIAANNAQQAYRRAVEAEDDAGALAAEDRFLEAEASFRRETLGIDDRDTMRLATLQVIVPVRNAQMADPELASALALFRRAANVVARLEDAIVFRGLEPNPNRAAGGPFAPPGGLTGLPPIWRITGALAARGLWTARPGADWSIRIAGATVEERAHHLVGAISRAIGRLEQHGHFGPFAVVLGQELFAVAQTPERGSLVLPQDRIIPFLGGGPLLRSSTLSDPAGVVVALGGAPIELVVATDMNLQFLQVSADPVFLFRISEKIALRIRERAVVQLALA
ncbi:MAG: encapsulin [Hyphomicrobiales bacterium]|nr:encapsulin [Hyphomicrobiales bacterium]